MTNKKRNSREKFKNNFFKSSIMNFKLCVFLFTLLTVTNVEAAQGYDFGDFLATILGLGIAGIGILACLGKYARQQARNEFI